jgi:hypothetical protein
MEKLRFSCTSLSSGVKGILPKDPDGYRKMPVGGLNMYNSVGDYYPYEGVQELFSKSSQFMRRIKTRCLKCEEGHPILLPGMTEDMYAQRILHIEETRVCAHIAEIELDFNSLTDNTGRPIVAIIARMKGDGIFGPALEKSFDNPLEDVCFSIRALTENRRVVGTTNRYIRNIITWDRVTEPGLDVARKLRAPSLEGFSEKAAYSQSLAEHDIAAESFVKAIRRQADALKAVGASFESAGLMTAEELFGSFRWSIENQKHLPASMQW